MSKWAGVIGFAQTVSGDDDIDRTTIVEKHFHGDVLEDGRRWNDAEKINGDFTINNRISVVAKDYMLTHLQYMRYITWEGAKWRITSMSIAMPRIILSLGDLYNGSEE